MLSLLWRAQRGVAAQKTTAEDTRQGKPEERRNLGAVKFLESLNFRSLAGAKKFARRAKKSKVSRTDRCRISFQRLCLGTTLFPKFLSSCEQIPRSKAVADPTSDLWRPYTSTDRDPRLLARRVNQFERLQVDGHYTTWQPRTSDMANPSLHHRLQRRTTDSWALRTDNR
jgi:hypothetical protein